MFSLRRRGCSEQATYALDEWLLMPLRGEETRDLLEIVEQRHKKGSTIFASQFWSEGWHGKIGEGPLADAILDRIIYDSYHCLGEPLPPQS